MPLGNRVKSNSENLSLAVLHQHGVKLQEHDLKFFSIERKLQEIDERTALIPKLYDNVDKLIGEIRNNREWRVFTDNRIRRIEKHVGMGT